MPLPYYVSPEQMMKDKAEYARKGIARGRSIVALEYEDGILLVAENPSTLLHKISEIYDRIAFAGVGKYNEFENLRIAGVRYADIRGYSYHREDVTARRSPTPTPRRSATCSREGIKPLEVEVLVAEVADEARTARTRCTTSSTTAPSRTSTIRRDGRPGGGDPPVPQGALPGRVCLADAVRLGIRSLTSRRTRR